MDLSHISANTSTPIKTFLITGAANGLGRALAQQLHSKQHQLILLDSDLKALNKLYDELDENGWNNVFLFPMNLATSAQAEFEQLAEGLAEFDQLDGLFLNAAILPALTPIEHFDPMQWYEVMQTNLNANFHLIQTCLPKLKASHHTPREGIKAWLVTISDQIVQNNQHFYGAYAVAKAGLEQLTRLVVAENPSLQGFIARFPPLAGHFRSKVYPGENPHHNETVESAAERLLKACFNQEKQREKQQDITVLTSNA